MSEERLKYKRNENSLALLLDDIQEEIEFYEESLKELEEEIADITVQIHDLEIVLRMFHYEYNAKVGVLYAKLDRIKLKIKEYKHRIELVRGRTLSAEDKRKIEEEISNLFSKDRKRMDDLEDEVTGASEEYNKSRDAEDNVKTYDREFLIELKNLFRKLAFKFHPDMAKDEKQKREFHKIFINIKEAYEKHDIETLRGYLRKAHLEEKKKNETLKEKRARLEKEYDRLIAFHDKLKMKIEAMQSSELYKLKERVNQAQEEDKDLLRELAHGIEQEITSKQEELDDLIREYGELTGYTL